MKYTTLIIFLFAIHQKGVAQDTNTVKASEPIADYAEVEPQFPGGDDAMAKFVQTNVIYPKKAKKRGQQGCVYVQFVVERDGSLNHVTVIKGVSKLLDAEAIRVIKLMPKWTPGMQKGKTVRVRFTLPINFRIT